MTFATTHPGNVEPAARVTTFAHAGPPAVAGRFRRAAVVAGDLLGIIAIVLCIPFVILAVTVPIVFGVGLLMWLAGLL
jgi:hypothetical protein